MNTTRFRPVLRVGKALLWIALALVILGQLAGPSRLRAARDELLSELRRGRAPG